MSTGTSSTGGIVAVLMLAMALAQEPLRVVGWNVESGGSDLTTIRNEIASFDGIDLWGLSEVPDAAAASLFEGGAEVGEGADFAAVVGSTGNNDRLAILYDDDRFDLVASFELGELQLSSGLRSALVAQLRETAGGLELLFVVNHLARSNAASRQQQAALLNAWARAQTLPVVAVGDYNFDYQVVGGETDHDPGFDLLLADGVFTWVRPEVLVRTQCSATSTAVTEDDCRFDSVLDFVFVAGAAQGWAGRSEIVVRPFDLPDSDSTSDHRPLLAEFSGFTSSAGAAAGASAGASAGAAAGTAAGAADGALLSEILARIEVLEAELAALRQLVLDAME